MSPLKLLAALLVVFSFPAWASSPAECPSADSGGFMAFLERFEDVPSFQRDRTVYPLVLRQGAYSMAEVQVSLQSREVVEAAKEPLIYTKQQLKAEGLYEEPLVITNRYAEVFQGNPEGDDYRMLYKFRNIEGCWFLEEVHDCSL